MVSSTSLRLSTVVPATRTGDENTVHELTNMDLAMKLHYIKGVYFFKSEAVEGLKIYDLKKRMFRLLQLYFTASRRIRRSKTGRPFIKCNDSGLRIVEAHYEEMVDEWFARAMEDSSLLDGLAYNQALGPDLGYSPLVFLQFTWFKCGGMAVELSWANVLGDAFSASAFMNMWGKIIADPIGDFCVTPNKYRTRKHMFHVFAEKLDHLVSNISCPPSNQSAKVSSAFEVLSAIIWKSLSKIMDGSEQIKRVTICTKNVYKREFGVLRAKLTFVNLEEAEIYGLELKGQKPVYTSYGISGVGDEGLVLVLPASTNNVGRLVSVVLPENQLAQLKSELQRNWSIA
ncbi:hypothetical protein EV1_043758 [Malus domestica]